MHGIEKSNKIFERHHDAKAPKGMLDPIKPYYRIVKE